MKAALFSAALIGSLTANAAVAADRYAATIDVNIRSGPGANYAIVEILHAGEAVTATKCETGWCSVSTPDGSQGFIAARFLSRRGTAPDNAAAAGKVPPTAVKATLDTMTTAAVAAVGSPASLTLPDKALKYVATHRPVSVELGSEAEVGGAVPIDIRLRDIPGSRYQYVYVDGHPVFVDGQTRRIVEVER